MNYFLANGQNEKRMYGLMISIVSLRYPTIIAVCILQTASNEKPGGK